MNIPKSLQGALLVGVSALALSCSAPMKSVESNQNPGDKIAAVIKGVKEKCGIDHSSRYGFVNKPTTAFIDTGNNGKLPKKAECVIEVILSQKCSAQIRSTLDGRVETIIADCSEEGQK